MRIVARLLRWLGWAVLSLLATAGVLVSGVALYGATPSGRAVLTGAIIHVVDEAVAGRVQLAGVEVLPGGAIELRGLQAFDPDGHLVLSVSHALVEADFTRLRSKVLIVSLELDKPTVLLEEEEGGVSLTRAFAPAHPSPPKPPRPSEGEPTWAGWTLRVARLTIRGADVWWVNEDGDTRFEASGLSLDGRALLSPGRSRAELRVTGSLEVPLATPATLEVRAALDGPELRVPVLRAQLGGTTLDGLAQLDLRTRVGRAAITRAGVARSQALSLLPSSGLGDDVAFHGYAESDGTTASAAVHVAPRGEAGGGDAAVAVRLDAARAMGADVALDRLDPQALYSGAPPGQITLRAHGGAAGDRLSQLRGQLELSLAPSRLRKGELGPAQASARVNAGSWEVRTLSLQAPGLSVQGSGRYRQGGEASGRFTVQSPSLAALGKNLELLLDHELPPLSGKGRVEATLAGTARAPVIDAEVDAPALAVGEVAVSGLEAKVSARGPLEGGQAHVEGTAVAVRSGKTEVVRRVTLQGQLVGETAQLKLSATAPAAGKDPYTVEANAELLDGRKALGISTLTLGWPGTRFTLAKPARVTFAGPAVDALVLTSGAQRIALEGGLGPKKALDARVEVRQLDLARLPMGLIPSGDGIAGLVDLEVRATGTTKRPEIEGRVDLENGAFRSEQGDRATALARWDGGQRRVSGTVTVTRAKGGRIGVKADLPLPLANRGAESVSASVELEQLPLEAILALVDEEDLPVRGVLGGTATVGGTVAAPTAHVKVGLREASYDELDQLDLELEAEGAADVKARLELGMAGTPVARLSATAPLQLTALLQRPGPTVRHLAGAQMVADLEVPGLDLSQLAGKMGMPDGLAGRVSGKAHMAGAPTAPRGTAAFELADGAYGDITGVAAHLEADAAQDATSLRARVALQGQELLTLAAGLSAPLEALRGERLRRAPLKLKGEIPAVDLARAVPSKDLLLTGTVTGTLEGSGTLARPEVTLALDGSDLAGRARPVGAIKLRARTGAAGTSAELGLAPGHGGELRATLAVDAPLGLDTSAKALKAAPARATLRAEGVELAFVPGLSAGTIRNASGKLDADVTASGPLARLVPKGTLRITDGQVAVSEYGEWSGIAVDASVDEDAIEVRTLEAHRGRGNLKAHAFLRGLRAPPAKLEGRIDAHQVLITRAGMAVATIDLAADASGSYKPGLLDARLDVGSALIRLPRKVPRTLQSLEDRPDIVIGREKEHPREPDHQNAMAIKAHLVAPGRVRVASDNPRIQLDLRADVTYERDKGEDYLTGSIETIRGYVEPLGGRVFEAQRGKVTFTGGPPKAALLDVQATWDNPTAKVTVAVAGPLSSPEVRLTSQPPLDEGQIALLIATGRTDLKAGQGGLTSMGSESDTTGGLGALGGIGATMFFKNVVQDRLPFDTVALDSTAVRAGKYVLDNRVYIGYTRRFDARIENGENQNEAHVEYQITPRWALEFRYGDGQSGGASLLWSKEY